MIERIFEKVTFLINLIYRKASYGGFLHKHLLMPFGLAKLLASLNLSTKR